MCCDCSTNIGLFLAKSALVALCVTVLLGYEASNDALGLFDSTVSELSDLYEFEISPPGWTFSIWAVIYVYQAMWIIYGLTLFCRRNPLTGKRLHGSPPFLSNWIYLVMIVNFGFNVAWLFLFDDRKLWLSAAALSMVTVTTYMALGIAAYDLNNFKQLMKTQGIKQEIRLVIGFVHNGIGMYAAWASIATLLNLGINLVHEEPHLKQTTASSLILSALAVEILTWVVLDNTLFAKYTTFLFTPYLVLIWALTGIVYKTWGDEEPLTFFALAVLLLAIVGLMIKILFVVCRRQKGRSDRTAVTQTRNDARPFVVVLNENKTDDKHYVTDML